MSHTRRRETRRRREAQALELDVRWSFRRERLPLYAVAVSVCSCGRQSWLMPGATAADREGFDRDSADHDYAHELEAGEANW